MTEDGAEAASIPPMDPLPQEHQTLTSADSPYSKYLSPLTKADVENWRITWRPCIPNWQQSSTQNFIRLLKLKKKKISGTDCIEQ